MIFLVDFFFDPSPTRSCAGARDDDLSFSKGDVIRVKKKISDGWWRGALGDNVGMFPSNYVNVLDESAAAEAINAFEASVAAGVGSAGGDAMGGDSDGNAGDSAEGPDGDGGSAATTTATGESGGDAGGNDAGTTSTAAGSGAAGTSAYADAPRERVMVFKEGWLEKKGGTQSGGRRNWKKRWFVLEQQTLRYYEKRPKPGQPLPKFKVPFFFFFFVCVYVLRGVCRRCVTPMS